RGEGTARRGRRGAYPRAGGSGGERRRLGLDRAAPPGGQGGCGGGSGAALPGSRSAVLGGEDRGGRPACLEVDADVRGAAAGGELPLAAVPASGKVDTPRGRSRAGQELGGGGDRRLRIGWLRPAGDGELQAVPVGVLQRRGRQGGHFPAAPRRARRECRAGECARPASLPGP